MPIGGSGGPDNPDFTCLHGLLIQRQSYLEATCSDPTFPALARSGLLAGGQHAYPEDAAKGKRGSHIPPVPESPDGHVP